MPSSTNNSPAARRARQPADEGVPSTAPPPYPGDNTYDLTPLPHTVNRPRLPEEKRNPHLSSGKYEVHQAVGKAVAMPIFGVCDSSPHSLSKFSFTFAVPADNTIVKFQTIVREGKEIVIGRIKVSTVSTSHWRTHRTAEDQRIVGPLFCCLFAPVP